jgi:hypothetical protein
MQLIFSFQNVDGSHVDDGMYLRTREQQHNSAEDSRQLEAGKEPSRGSEDIADQATPRAIYGLLVSILETFHLSALGEMNRMMETFAQNSTNLSDLADSAKEMGTT